MTRERGSVREARGGGGGERKGEEQVKEARQTADVAAASPRTELQD